MNLYENIEKEIDKLYSKFEIMETYNEEENEKAKSEIIQEYGLSEAEMEQIKKDIKFEFYLYRETCHDYNNGDMYYDDSHIEDMRKKVIEEIKENIKKYITRKKISEIKTEEITPELIEELQKNGFKGEYGSPVLQSYFKMYNNTLEKEEEINEYKSKIKTLENKKDRNDNILEALKIRDKQSKKCIDNQEQYIENIIQSMNYIKQQSDELKPYLKDKSLGKKVIGFFSRSKKNQIKEAQKLYLNNMIKENNITINDCYRANQIDKPMNLNNILENMPRKVRNNMYDKIVSPIENSQNVIDLVNLYATLKDSNQLDRMYDYIVNEHKENQPKEKEIYEENFYSFIVEPAANELEEKIKQGKYERFNDTFRHLYTIDEMKQMFREKSAKDIINKGREIENKNKDVYDKINLLFANDNYRDADRRPLYVNYLKKNNINLNEEELLDWMDYRATMEEFQSPRLMGFHIGDPLENEEKMKIYINAGSDTYEIANLFSNNCKQQIGISPKLKVAIGDMSSEINRKDKLCIYAESIKQAKQYIETLEKIKSERKDFKFEKPTITAGTMNNWIGIGSDMVGNNSSYNLDFCDMLIETCNSYFFRLNKTQIIEQLKNNPKILEYIKNDIGKISMQKGRSQEKICIRKEDDQLLKQTEINEIQQKDIEQTITGTKTIEEIINNKIKPSEISNDLMLKLQENGYDGKSGHPFIQAYYQLFCKNQYAEQNKENNEMKIEKLENDLDEQNNKMEAFGARNSMFKNTIEKQMNTLGYMRGMLGTVYNQINNLQESMRPKGIIEKIKSIFTPKQNLLPANLGCEVIDLNINQVCKIGRNAKDFMQQNNPNSVEEIVRSKKIVKENTKSIEKELVEY